MKPLFDTRPNSRKKQRIGTVLSVLGGIIILAGLILVISQQIYGGPLSIMSGLMFFLCGSLFNLSGILVGRNEQQCSEENAESKMSPNLRKKQTIGTTLVACGCITLCAFEVLLIVDNPGDIWSYGGLIAGAIMVFQGGFMRHRVCESQQTKVDAGTEKV